MLKRQLCCLLLRQCCRFWQQCSTLSKGRNFNAKLVRHCCRFWQVERCFDIVAKNGNNVEASFDIVAFDNVASTLLLVWTGLYVFAAYRKMPGGKPIRNAPHPVWTNLKGQSADRTRTMSHVTFIFTLQSADCVRQCWHFILWGVLWILTCEFDYRIVSTVEPPRQTSRRQN